MTEMERYGFESIVDSAERYLLGELEPSELAQLEELLLSDEDAAACFAQVTQQIGTMREVFTEQDRFKQRMGQASLEDYLITLSSLSPTKPVPPVQLDDGQQSDQEPGVLQLLRQPIGMIGVGIVAALAIAVTLVIVFSGGNTPGPVLVESPGQIKSLANPVATLSASNDAQWAKGVLTPGSSLYAGQRLTLLEGFAQITTGRGAVVILEAPATIELLDNNNALRLHTGKLVGICETESSKGLLVRTPHMDVTDLGTRFGVDATSPQATEAHVIEGLVRVKAKGSFSSRELSAGHALAVNDAGEVSVIQLAASDFIMPEHFGVAAMPAAYEALRRDPAMIAYYGFEADDLRDGRVLNRADATAGKMDGVLGQPGREQSAPTLTAGRFPGTSAMRFEASESDVVRISIEDADALDGIEQFTIGLWVRPNNTDCVSHHLVSRAGDALNFGLAWDGTPASGYPRNAVFFHSRVEVEKAARVLSSEADTLQRRPDWIHMAVIYDRGERAIYIDGRFVTRLPRNDSVRIASSDAELWIGAKNSQRNLLQTYLDGDLDELFILGRLMSADEIATLYETGVLD